MTHAERPPDQATADEIVTSWLPDFYRRSGRRAPPDAPLVRLTLSGTGGGDFLVCPDDDELRVQTLPPGRQPRGDDPDVWLRQPTADFLATFRPTPDLPEILPPGWSPLELLFLDPRDVELLQRFSGRVMVEVAGKRRRRWTLDAAFGQAGMAAGRPRATVQIDGVTYEGLRTQTLVPMQALLDGRLRMQGDRALAMQAMLLIATRMSRR